MLAAWPPIRVMGDHSMFWTFLFWSIVVLVGGGVLSTLIVAVMTVLICREPPKK
jgi:hypothetical protein